MKKTLVRITLAALAVVLLGSCEKINQRIDALEDRLDGIETEKIASIDSQIASINSSIADLGTIRSNISDLKKSSENHGIDIFNLEEADRALNDRILNLEDYLDDVLPTYAEKDWVKATFSTLAQYEATCDTIAKIDARIGKLDERLSKEIKACADSMKRWVNVQFEAYYTAAEMDAALEYMQAEIDSAKVSGKITDERVDSLANELTKTKAAVDSAKAQLTREYKAAIDTAITHCEGRLTKALTDAITKVNDDITALTTRVSNLEVSVATLTGRVDKLEKMIQSVTIVPAYSDGSVKVEDDTLYLDCIISPASAVSTLTKANFTVLVNEVLTKAVDVKTISITEDKWFSMNAQNGTVSLKVPVKNYIPASANSSLTAAVNVQNGISDFTTEFVPVYVDKRTFKAVYNTNDGDSTLTFYFDDVDHSGDGITVYDNLPVKATTYTDWGYDGIRGNIKSVKIDPSVAGYKGLTSTVFMFYGMTNADSISGAEYLDVSNVTDMYSMFNRYGKESTSLTDVPVVSEWNTGNVTNMSNLFDFYGYNSKSLTAPPDVSKWNTGKVTNMYSMFSSYGKNSTSLTAVPDVSGWKTDNVEKMGNLFANYGDANKNNINCVLDLTGWNLANLAPNNNVFNNFSPNTFKVTIPAKTGENANLPSKWYGSGTSFFAPPEGKTFTPPLAGVFSVSATKKVHFSQGNLTYNVTNTTWAFYEHQYECATEYDSTLISLFTWGYDAAKSIVPDGTNYVGGHTTDGETFSKTEDWGYVFGGESSVWRTLTKDEWVYLFNTRTMTNSKARYSNVVDGVTIGGTTYKGVFLYPDNYNGEVVSSSMTWDAINAAGIVFLPAAGYREGSDVSYVGTYGFYWSSSARKEDDEAYDVGFDSNGVTPGGTATRDCGFSVRLVTEVK